MKGYEWEVEGNPSEEGRKSWKYGGFKWMLTNTKCDKGPEAETAGYVVEKSWN